jgi:sucrose-phosphate synthase
MGQRILEALEDENQWRAWSENGVQGVHRSFSWESHARRYLMEVERALGNSHFEERRRSLSRRHRLPRLDRILVIDVDNTLTGDAEALKALEMALEEAGHKVGFAVATGRSLARAMEIFQELGLRTPDILISATGTEIHYGEPLVMDQSWKRQIKYRWDPERVRESLSSFPGLTVAEEECITPLRLRFRLAPTDRPTLAQVRRHLRREGVNVTATLDHGRDLDITPVRASPGLAIRFLAHKWNVAPRRILVAGDSGNDADMLSGETLGVVVGNHTPELEALEGHPRVYFAQGHHAWGVLEGIRHYDFFGSIRIPEEDDE